MNTRHLSKATRLLDALKDYFETEMNTQFARMCGISGYLIKGNAAKDRESNKLTTQL